MDENLSSIMGAEDLSSIHEILFRYEQAHLPEQFSNEDDRGSRALGMLYRMGKSILFENIQEGLLILTQHEVFGHGARLREFGYQDARYQFHLVPPYGTGGGFTAWGSSPSFSNDQWTSIHIAGVESEAILADELRMRALERGSINYREAQLYFLEKLSLPYYAHITTSEDLTSHNANDIASYINQVQSRNSQVTLSRIKSNSLLNLIDPFTLGWLYFYGYRYLRNAQEETPIPMFKVGRWKYLPGFRFTLTPFGYEYCLETLLTDSGRVAEITTSMGSADNGTSVSIGLKTRNIWTLGPVVLDGKILLWHQPLLGLIDQGYSLINSPASWSVGGLMTIGASVKISTGSALTIDAGYKSMGFAEGEILNSGPIFRAGIILGE